MKKFFSPEVNESSAPQKSQKQTNTTPQIFRQRIRAILLSLYSQTLPPQQPKALSHQQLERSYAPGSSHMTRDEDERSIIWDFCYTSDPVGYARSFLSDISRYQFGHFHFWQQLFDRTRISKEISIKTHENHSQSLPRLPRKQQHFFPIDEIFRSGLIHSDDIKPSVTEILKRGSRQSYQLCSQSLRRSHALCASNLDPHSESQLTWGLLNDVFSREEIDDMLFDDEDTNTFLSMNGIAIHSFAHHKRRQREARELEESIYRALIDSDFARSQSEHIQFGQKLRCINTPSL